MAGSAADMFFSADDMDDFASFIPPGDPPANTLSGDLPSVAQMSFDRQAELQKSCGPMISPDDEDIPVWTAAMSAGVASFTLPQTGLPPSHPLHADADEIPFLTPQDILEANAIASGDVQVAVSYTHLTLPTIYSV